MTSPLSICLVSSAYHPYPSGVSEHVYHLASELVGLGHRVEVLTSHHPGKPGITEPAPVHRLGRVVRIPLNGSYATLPVGLRLSSAVRRYLATREPDVVHCHGFGWPELSYWAALHSRTTTVVSILTSGFKVRSRGGSIFRLLFRRQLERIDALVPISSRALESVKAYLTHEYRIIPSGVDLERFHPDLPPLPDPVPELATILFLGRLDPRKGLSVLLKALPAVRRSIDARLVVVGSGPEAKTARRLVRKLEIEDRVIFAGTASPEDLPRYYAGCDVYCSPALGGESLGIVLLEAMACGRPVVASNIPGYDETVRDGVEGLLVPPGDPESIARALIQVLTDRNLSRRLASAGIERAREYAWPRIARRTLDFYVELLGRR